MSSCTKPPVLSKRIGFGNWSAAGKSGKDCKAVSTATWDASATSCHMYRERKLKQCNSSPYLVPSCKVSAVSLRTARNFQTNTIVKHRRQQPRLQTFQKVSNILRRAMFENIKIDVSYFLLHNVYTHDTHRERVDTYMATCYIYTYHKMTTCVFAQTSLHMLYAKINLENSQLSKQHVKTTLQYAANSFHKTWRFPEAVISILFQHRRWGQGHRLSGSTPPIFR